MDNDKNIEKSCFAKVCNICQRPNGKKCSGCGNAYYCSTDHQKKDWRNHKDFCNNWKVEGDQSQARGRYVVATRGIRSGEIVLQESPTLVGPKTLQPDPICLACHYPIPVVRIWCTVCKVPLCDPKCERSNFHQFECPFLAKRTNKTEEFEDFDLIPAFRFLFWKKKDPLVFTHLLGLCSNISEKQKSPSWETVQSMAMRLQEKYFLKELLNVDANDIVSAICTIDSNSFQLPSKSTGKPMTGIYIKSSMFNHSCLPNARAILTANHSLKIVATADISCGEEITISYIDSLHTTMQRRAILQATKHFICNCNRCTDPTEFNTFSSALRCTSCAKIKNNSGWVVSTKPLLDSAVWQCVHCKLFLDAATAISLEKQLMAESEKINPDNFDQINKFFSAYSPVLYPKHVFLIKLKVLMFQALRKQAQTASSSSGLERLIQLGTDLIEDVSKLEAKESFFLGVLSLEVCDTIFKYFHCQQSMQGPQLNPAELKARAKSLSQKSVLVLKNEDEVTNEGALGKKALELDYFFSN